MGYPIQAMSGHDAAKNTPPGKCHARAVQSKDWQDCHRWSALPANLILPEHLVAVKHNHSRTRKCQCNRSSLLRLPFHSRGTDNMLDRIAAGSRWGLFPPDPARDAW